MNIPLIALVLVGVLAIWCFMTYNGFIAKRNQVRSALSSIDVNLKLRHDLIPNLIESVKGYMKHEKELLTELTSLREQAAASGLNEAQRFELEGKLGAALQGIRLRAEAYPELKASDSFVHLQKSLAEVEAQLSASRRAYNSSVERFNNAVEMFPSSIIAGMMSLGQMEFFEATDTERDPVKVDFR